MLHSFLDVWISKQLFNYLEVSMATKSICAVYFCFPGNRIKALPQSITKLKCLRSLDISDNKITSLPSELCHVRTLETLLLDAAMMTSPSPGQRYVNIHVTPALIYLWECSLCNGCSSNLIACCFGIYSGIFQKDYSGIMKWYFCEALNLGNPINVVFASKIELKM